MNLDNRFCDLIEERINLDFVLEEGSDVPKYSGEYVVIPKTTAQELETTNKVLSHNVEVKAIPYSQTTNLSGGYTAIIGG